MVLPLFHVREFLGFLLWHFLKIRSIRPFFKVHVFHARIIFVRKHVALLCFGCERNNPPLTLNPAFRTRDLLTLRPADRDALASLRLWLGLRHPLPERAELHYHVLLLPSHAQSRAYFRPRGYMPLCACCPRGRARSSHS